MSAAMLLWIKVKFFIVAMVTKQILKTFTSGRNTQKMHFCPYFEKYLLKSLDIWLTHGIIGDVQNDIRKLTLVKVKVIQTKVKCSKRAIFQ